MNTNSRHLEDFDVMYNLALGAAVLWSFTKEYYDVTLKTRGPVLPLLMPVLPLVFHRGSVEKLGSRNLAGGLYRGLTEDRTLPAGLQKRMEHMADRTLDALGLAYISGLMMYEPESASVLPLRRTLPSDLRQDRIRPLLGTAHRLGHWCGELSIEQIVGLLKVRF